MIEIIKLGVKADMLLRNEGMEYPPSQETMRSVFGRDILLPGSEMTAGNYMQVMVPPGLRAGDTFHVTGPSGRRFEVVVPPGVAEGQTLQVQIPAPQAATEESEMAPFRSNMA